MIVSISIDEKLLAQLDSLRGDVSRSKFVRNIVKEKIESDSETSVLDQT